MKVLKIMRILSMKAKLRRHGVRFGAVLRGNRPFIKNNGQIVLGDRVSLNSYPGGELCITGLQTHLQGSSIKIGDDCNLNGTMIHCRTSIEIGNYCLFGPGTKIIDNNSHRVSIDRFERRKSPEGLPIKIDDNVWVGMNSLIMKGVTIGENSIVAAYSVVTKSVPANVVVAGSPAVVIKNLTD